MAASRCGAEWRRADSYVIDVLERVMDKGIVIDAWIRASRAEIDLLTAEGRVVITSITTCIRGPRVPL